MQTRSIPEGLRIDLPNIGHPVDGGNTCIAVQADSAMRLRSLVGRFFAKPQNRATVTFLDRNESVIPSSGLEFH